MIERHPPVTGQPPAEAADMQFADLPHADGLRQLLEIWQSWPQETGIPTRNSFDPTSVPPRLLPWIGLTEFDSHHNPYRSYDVLYRYIGSGMAEFFKIEQRTRQYLSDVGPAIAQRWFHVYDHLLNTAKPFAVRGIPYLINREYLQFELMVLPLRRSTAVRSVGQGSDVSPEISAMPRKDVAFGLFAVHVTSSISA